MSESPKQDMRLMCDRCGEFGKVVLRGGVFCVERYDGKELCCCTPFYGTAAEAIARWQKLWSDEAELERSRG